MIVSVDPISDFHNNVILQFPNARFARHLREGAVSRPILARHAPEDCGRGRLIFAFLTFSKQRVRAKVGFVPKTNGN